MELRTYTALWKMERRLYRIDDLHLPGAPTFRMIGVFVAFAIPWLTVMAFLGVPFSPPWNVLWIGPPILVPWLANRPLAENKTGLQLATSHGKYLLQPRTLSRLRGTRPPRNVHLEASTYRPAPESV